MDREGVLKTLAAHRSALEAYNIKSLALFGSVARGEERPDSDVDLLVEFAGPATFHQYMDLKIFLEESLGCSVDLVTKKALKPRLRPHVERDAVYVT